MESPRCIVRIQAGAFDAAAEADALIAGRTDIGALVTFTGLCRDEGNTLAALEIEHYPGMADAEIAAIVAEASSRWPLQGITVIHRYGRIEPGAPIVLVVAASAHRAAAFEAAHFLMDYLKNRAPFWKKQHFRAGASHEGTWVAPRETDAAAAAGWEDAGTRVQPIG